MKTSTKFIARRHTLKGYCARGDTVRFHTPLADENPDHRYTLLDDPAEREAMAAKLRADGFPRYKAQVRIQLITDKMTFKPIQTVPLADLCAC